ncbi:hypothetical protein ACJMK2_024656 [Sinanodonta woodiana]|uniref:Uncharacterized protein n=1 Tax=Sinanodonta woodiana TaxID=1069815 RepID=A0ABD3XE17_SINWO
MDTVAKLGVFLMLCGVGHSIDNDIIIATYLLIFQTINNSGLKPDLYAQGESATVHINQLRKNGKKILEINFSGYASKLHVTNVMLYDTTKRHDNYISINRNYTGRITHITPNYNSLSFRLRNVTFMDSGNYTIFEDSIENGKTSILVARFRLTGQDKEPMVLPFLYNQMNISTIQIEMLIPSMNFPVLIYDVKKDYCTTLGQLYMARIQNCELSGNRFSFTFRDVSWLDKGMYVAWDDKGFILDTIMVDYEDLSESIPSNAYDEHVSEHTVEPSGSSTSYKIKPPSSSEKCQFQAYIGMNGVFDQMFKVETERLSIERERLRTELERMKVEKRRLTIETERLGLEIERTEILKSKSTY